MSILNFIFEHILLTKQKFCLKDLALVGLSLME